MCVFVLRPFFGQCIFNIIFAATSPSLFRPPFPLSCCGRNFFRFLFFGCFLPCSPLPQPSPYRRPLAATLFAMGVYVFFPHTPPAESWGLVAAHWQLSGLQVASLHMRNALNAFVFLSSSASHHPLPLHAVLLFFAFKLGVEVKRTVGWAGLVISGRHCHACNNKCCKGAGSLATNTFCHISRKYF